MDHFIMAILVMAALELIIIYFASVMKTSGIKPAIFSFVFIFILSYILTGGL